MTTRVSDPDPGILVEFGSVFLKLILSLKSVVFISFFQNLFLIFYSNLYQLIKESAKKVPPLLFRPRRGGGG